MRYFGIECKIKGWSMTISVVSKNETVMSVQEKIYSRLKNTF